MLRRALVLGLLLSISMMGCDDDPADGDADVDGDGDGDGGPEGWPEGVILIELDAAGTASVPATFEGASPLSDLAFLSDPAVACYDTPSTTDEFYSASHVAFALAEPLGEWSDVTITITPESGVEANIYVVQEAPDRYDVAPEIAEAQFCHQPIRFGTPGEAQTVTFRLYGGQASNVFFGVSNRGRFPNDDTGSFQVDLAVAPVAGADRCYSPVDDPNQWPAHVTRVALDENGEAVLVGDVAGGAPVCGDHSYLDDAFCVPETQLDHFRGNQVFYAIEGGIPAHSVLSVTLTPDPGVELNLYGASEGTTDFYVPPNFPLTICEASLQHPGTNPGEAESITFVAITNPYNVFFAVAGDAATGDAGGYTLAVTLIDTRTDLCEDADYEAVTGLTSWPASVTQIDVVGGVGFELGDLADGTEQCTLDWAANSSVACFPLTDRAYFDGRHQFFALAEPPPAGSNVTFRVIPDPDVEVSAYAYWTGPDTYLVPPLVPSVGACEASYNQRVYDDLPNPGQIEEVEFYNVVGGNQYNYFIGVAAYDGGLQEGAYVVEVEVVEPPPPHCPESLPGATYPTWPSSVSLVGLDGDGHGEASGDLGEGSCMNLDWADSSQVACFPATQFDRFEGNHVFYALDQTLPPRSELTITATPRSGVEVSLYGLQVGTGDFPLPPAVSTAICEASYGWSGPNPGAAETITFSNPSDTNEYNIFFAVAGDDASGTAGAYDLELQLEVGVVHCPESLPGPTGLSDWPAGVTLIDLDAEGDGSAVVNLSNGSCMNLDFAAQSDVACFPATENENFEGNHVFYALAEPMPPRSELTVIAVPLPGLDVSLYGFQLGATEYMVPPSVTGTICEASYGYDLPNPGEVETITFSNPSDTNEYNVFIAVAGTAEGGTEGFAEVQAHLEVGTPFCEASLPGASYSDWPAEVTQIDLDGAGHAQFIANLSGGVPCVNLEWADDSDVACFPATESFNFEGRHVYYAINDPLPPHSELTVTLRPGPAVDANLYGYQTGTSTFYVPPLVTSVVSCEASYPWRNPNPGEVETIHFSNPTATSEYQIFFAVAGNGDTGDAGGYQVEIQLTE